VLNALIAVIAAVAVAVVPAPTALLLGNFSIHKNVLEHTLLTTPKGQR